MVTISYLLLVEVGSTIRPAYGSSRTLNEKLPKNWLLLSLNIKPKVHHIAVLHYIFFAF